MSQEIATRRNPLGTRLLIIPLAIIVYLLLLYAIQPSFEGYAWLVLDMNSVLLALASTVVFLIVARRFDWRSTKPGQIMVTIVIGFVLWTVAETVWLLCEFAGIDTFPYSDIFYIAGYIPIALALLMNIRTIHVKFKLPILVLWIAISLIVFVVITVFEVIPIVAGASDIETLVSVVYPYEDLLVIVLALVIMLKFRAGEIAKSWGLLILGFLLEAVGDIWYTYATYTETYAQYAPVDLFLNLGYVAIIASGLLYISTFGARGGGKNA